jgi:uncharacterized membrane protein YraQ (UPF0718 family)
MRSERRRVPRTAARLIGWLVAALALGAVFSAYLDPHRVVELANRVWSCF